jgi:hypothetical protein
MHPIAPKLLPALTGALALLAAPPAAAVFEGLEAPVGALSFAEVDADGDGRVTAREARLANIPKRQLQRADRDGDGALDPREFREIEPDRGPGMD